MNKKTFTPRKRRTMRIRAKIAGTASRPRLAVFRSNRFIYAQLIDDVARKTLGAANDAKDTVGTKSDRAKKVGAAVATAAKAAGVSAVVFDRGGYRYTGRVQALADGAREAGLTF